MEDYGRMLRTALVGKAGTNLRCFRHTATIAFAGLALASCKTEAPTASQTLREKQHEENAGAGYMVRLGYDKLVAACGYELGRRNAPRSELRTKCIADFAFTGPITGEP